MGTRRATGGWGVRATRERPVRFCEGGEVRSLSATRLVILIDAHRRHDWLLPAVEKRLREELVALRVEVNEEKSRIVDLSRGESFGDRYRQRTRLRLPKTCRFQHNGSWSPLDDAWSRPS